MQWIELGEITVAFLVALTIRAVYLSVKEGTFTVK